MRIEHQQKSKLSTICVTRQQHQGVLQTTIRSLSSRVDLLTPLQSKRLQSRVLRKKSLGEEKKKKNEKR